MEAALVRTPAAVQQHPRLIGRVTHVHGEYGFIGIGTVTKTDGQRHVLGDKDVFVHTDDVEGTLELHKEVAFDVIPDPKRSGGYRACRVQAVEIITVDAELVEDEPTLAPTFALMSRHGDLARPLARDPHRNMKTLPVELVELAVANKPLDGLPRDEQEVLIDDNPHAVALTLENYLRLKHQSLEVHGMDYRITGYDEEAQKALIATAVREYFELSMKAQATLLTREYERFAATRAMLAWILQKGWLRPGTPIVPSMLSTLVKVVEGVDEGYRKNAMTLKIQETVGFMAEHGLLRPNTLLPMHLLPELFCAVPVWFFAAEHMSWEASQKFGKLFGQSWSDFYRLFNGNPRVLSMYSGEQIPLRLMRIIREAKKVFDSVVVMTPYHDLIVEGWERPMDPYVVGFKEGLPVFFVLGRFSDTGVFPLLHELTGDTMNFLARNKHKASVYDSRSHNQRQPMNHFIDNALKAFREGRLYAWLREGDAAT